MGRRALASLVGSKRHFLTVIEELPESRLRVECDCGVVKDIDKGNFGPTKSCGCMKEKLQSQNQLLPNGWAARNHLLYRYKTSAEERGLSFLLSEDEFYRLLDGNCEYCGIAPSATHTASKTSSYRYNGIDRVDNTIGYEPGNVVSCCKLCNVAKSSLTISEFLEWTERIHAHQQAKGVVRRVPTQS